MRRASCGPPERPRRYTSVREFRPPVGTSEVGDHRAPRAHRAPHEPTGCLRRRTRGRRSIGTASGNRRHSPSLAAPTPPARPPPACTHLHCPVRPQHRASAQPGARPRALLLLLLRWPRVTAAPRGSSYRYPLETSSVSAAGGLKRPAVGRWSTHGRRASARAAKTLLALARTESQAHLILHRAAYALPPVGRRSSMRSPGAYQWLSVGGGAWSGSQRCTRASAGAALRDSMNGVLERLLVTRAGQRCAAESWHRRRSRGRWGTHVGPCVEAVRFRGPARRREQSRAAKRAGRAGREAHVRRTAGVAAQQGVAGWRRAGRGGALLWREGGRMGRVAGRGAREHANNPPAFSASWSRRSRTRTPCCASA